MKRYGAMMACGLAFSVLPLGGCLEIAVKTTISDDGSSERVISVKRPTKSVPGHGYPLPSDSSWTAEWKDTGDKDQPYEYVARKRFATPDDLAAEYADGPDSGAVRLSVTLEKDFEWFYTYLDYREEYALANPFNRVPARSFFSGDEIARIAAGQHSDSLTMKIEEWDYRNQFEEFYATLISQVGEGDRDVSRARLEAVREEAYRISREDTSGGDGDEIGNAVRVLGRALGSRPGDRLLAAITRAVARTDSMEERRASADRWISSVVMPGLLVSTNGGTVEGNEVRWTIEAKQLLVTVVAMEVRSRVTNTWAFGVTGAAALVLLVPAGLALVRRKKLR